MDGNLYLVDLIVCCLVVRIDFGYCHRCCQIVMIANRMFLVLADLNQIVVFLVVKTGFHLMMAVDFGFYYYYLYQTVMVLLVFPAAVDDIDYLVQIDCQLTVAVAIAAEIVTAFVAETDVTAATAAVVVYCYCYYRIVMFANCLDVAAVYSRNHHHNQNYLYLVDY